MNKITFKDGTIITQITIIYITITHIITVEWRL